jgi:radical SAM-linked protein
MRLRITFSKTEAMCFTSHLDLHRAWERTFRRAQLPLAYSLGYSPHPKINLASALPLGFTSEAEIVDAWLESVYPVDQVKTKLVVAVPPGIEIHGIQEIDNGLPSLQSQLKAQEYIITLLEPLPDLEKRINSLLKADSIPRERRKKQYDLRPLVLELSQLNKDASGNQRLHTRLTAREGATGRPEEVLTAMDGQTENARFHRTKLLF